MTTLKQTPADPLWAAYWQDKSDANRNALYDFYHKLIGHVVGKWLGARRMSHLFDEVMSYVSERVLKTAIPRYSAERKVPFSGYLRFHIFGGIRDGLRAADTIPRLDRQRAAAIIVVQDQLAHELGRMPVDAEIAERMGLPEIKVMKLTTPLRRREKVRRRCDDDDETDGYSRPPMADEFYAVEDELDETLPTFGELLRGVPQRTRLIFLLYFVERLNMQEVGESVGLSESRVSQTIKETLAFLRQRKPPSR